ncbi:hypothetical protein ACLESO_23125 [Pyxidicoccus sp. 3LG]
MAENIPPVVDQLTMPPISSLKEPQAVVYAELPPDVTMKPETIPVHHKIFIVSTLVMIITSLATFYLPLFSGLLAGTFGGFHAGRLKRALAAAAVTAVAVPALLRFLMLLAEENSNYLFWGLGFWGWTAVHVVGTFIGAAAGAASRPVLSGEFLQRAPASVSASPVPAPGVVPPPRPATSTETVTRDAAATRVPPPSGPARGE